MRKLLPSCRANLQRGGTKNGSTSTFSVAERLLHQQRQKRRHGGIYLSTHKSQRGLPAHSSTTSTRKAAAANVVADEPPQKKIRGINQWGCKGKPETLKQLSTVKKRARHCKEKRDALACMPNEDGRVPWEKVSP